MKTVSFRNLKVGRPSTSTPLLELDTSTQSALTLKPGLQILVAPNGHGKSTLFQTLAGTLPALGGEIRYGESRLNPSEDVLYISEYLTFPKFIYPSEWIEFLSGRPYAGETEKFLAPWIQKFQLEKPFKTFLGRQSQGERRKTTWLAAHTSTRPIVLLDEPLDGLDLYGIRAAREMLGEWKNQDRTVLLIAHQVSEVIDLCDEVFLIHNRRVLSWAEAHAGVSIGAPATLGSDRFREAVMKYYQA